MRAALRLSLSLAVLGVGCSDPVPQLPPPIPSARPSSANPVAQADELEEGTVEAFGVKMPARSALLESTPFTQIVDVPADVPRTLKYLKARFSKFSENPSAGMIILTGVQTAANPQRTLRIVVKATTMTTQVTLRVEPGPVPSGAVAADSADEAN